MGGAVGLLPKGLFRAGHSCPTLFPIAFPYRKEVQALNFRKCRC